MMMRCMVVVSLTLALSCSDAQKVKLTSKEQAAFVSTHNSVRVDSGVKTLVAWDNTLAAFAEKHASKCEFEHSTSSYGENLFASWPTDNNYQSLAVNAVQSWASEKKFVKLHDWSCIHTGECGHYSQVVWKATKSIGCAIAHCPEVDNLVVCEYSPAGNVNSQKPY